MARRPKSSAGSQIRFRTDFSFDTQSPLATNGRICHNGFVKSLTKTSMTSVNISLPTNQRQFVKQKVSKGGYSTVSEYFRELIRKDEQREAEVRLESLLLQALESGEPTPMTKNDWEDVRKEVMRRAKQRKKGQSKR